MYPLISSYPLDSWMGFLHKDVENEPITRLSIPGTHNSCAIRGLGIARTQILPLEWQLLHGVRYLDIRCAIASDGPYLKIYHGPIYQGFTFGKVLTKCIDFLDKHPTETIVMRVQHEWTTNNTDYRSIFTTKYLDEGVAVGRFWLDHWIPTLREARGKIVLLSGNPYLNRGLHFFDQEIQDDYNNPAIEVKKTKIKDCVHSSVNSSGNVLFINHLSATGNGKSLWTPWDYAEVMNQYTLDLLMDNYDGKTQLGIFAKDYELDTQMTPHHMLTVVIVAANKLNPPPWSPFQETRHAIRL